MTAPKFSVVGDKESEPVVPPVPARFTVVVVALLVTLMLPVTAPAALGPNFVVKVMLCPAFNVSGKFNPEKLNAAPLNDADISFTLVPRPFLIVTSCVALLPTAYSVEGARFVDASGAQLSDHRPVTVTFDLLGPP